MSGALSPDLTIPDDVTIKRQVLAEPSLDLAERSWAQLDGTPLVTAEKRGKGWLVLMHTGAPQNGPASFVGTVCGYTAPDCRFIPRRIKRFYDERVHCLLYSYWMVSGGYREQVLVQPLPGRGGATGRGLISSATRLLRPRRFTSSA